MKTLFLCLLLFPTLSHAQEFCRTSEDISPEQELIYLDSASAQKSIAIGRSYTVRVFFHIVRDSHGGGGQKISVLSTVKKNLDGVFNPHNILFDYIGFDEINMDDFVTFDDTKFNRLARTQFIANAINVYLLNDNTYNDGDASGIPGLALVVGGKIDRKSLVTSLALTHEMGHCLGLMHTWSVKKGIERVDGTNCKRAGDLVCDTPADHMDFRTDGDCHWTPKTLDRNNQTYKFTDPGNNMTTHRRPVCYRGFTKGQGDLMRQTLGSSSVLKPAWQ
jgi:hypothetical protein